MKKISGKRMNGRTKSIIALTIAAVLTIFFGIVGVTGMNLTPNGLYKLKSWLPTTNAENWPDSLALGLDLRGGVYVEYSCAAPEGSEADFGTLLSGTIRVIQERLTDKGYAEATVQQIGTDGIRVEIPDVTDPSAVLDLIGSTAKLEFKDPEGNTFMDGSMVKTAVYQFNEGDHQVAFTLTDEGAKIFADMTSNNIGKTLGIYLDGEELLAPTVQSAITTGSGVITQMQSAEYAQTVAAQIQSGALPMELTQQKVDTVSATLGTDALSTSVLGLVHDVLMMLSFMVLLRSVVQMNSSFIAAMLTIVGYSINNTIVIFDRIRENAKKLSPDMPRVDVVNRSVQECLGRTINTTLTTLITIVLLYILGVDSIREFALPIIVGLLSGVYSANMINGYVWAFLEEKRKARKAAPKTKTA